MPLALFVSPHLDDVAFSCSGLLATLAAKGWQCVLVTTFTGSVTAPQGFALACQIDKGLPVDCDYMQLRRCEDAAYVASLNRSLRPAATIIPIWLPLLEAPHRGYSSAKDLFGTMIESDHAIQSVTMALGMLISCLAPALVVGPSGYGNHVDHRAVIAALQSLVGAAIPRVYYRDTPYILKSPHAAAVASVAATHCVALDIERFEILCLDAIACYQTQVPFQFGSVSQMRRCLGEAYRTAVSGRITELMYTDEAAAILFDVEGIELLPATA